MLWFEDQQEMWYVLARKDNGYPLLVYADKERGEHMAHVNKEVLVPVKPVQKRNELNDLMPNKDGSTLSEERMIEQGAVRRILVRAGLSGAHSCDTFKELVMQTGFPFRLVVYKFKPNELDDLDFDMMRRPTKAPIIVAIDEIFESNPGVTQCDLGMVFLWQGRGGLHVLTNDPGRLIHPGTSGRFWLLGGIYYLLEPIDSFVARLGPPDEW